MKLGRIGENFKSRKRKNSFYFLGNLLFYNGTSVDPTSRYFYFKMLNSGYAKNGSTQYLEKANAIGAAAVKELNKNPFQSQDETIENSRTFIILEEAIKILREGIEYEKQNEKKYIQRQLREFEKLYQNNPDELNYDAQIIQELIQIFQNAENGFDYNAFINLINILLTGAENVKELYDFEIEHIKDIENRVSIAKKNYLSKIGGLKRSGKTKEGVEIEGEETEKVIKSTKMLERAEERFERTRTKTYLNATTFNLPNNKNVVVQHLRKATEGTEAPTVRLAHAITDFLQNLFANKNFVNQVSNIISSNGITKNGYAASQDNIKSLIITSVITFSRKHYKDILKNKNYKLDLNELIADIQKNAQQSYSINIHGLYNNFAQYGKQVEYFKSSLQDILNNNASGNGLYDALVKFKKEIKGTKIRNLRQDQQFIRKKLNLQKKDSKWNKLLELVEELEQYQKKIQTSTKKGKKIEPLTLKSMDVGKEVTLTVTINDNKEVSIQGLDQLINAEGMESLYFKSFSPKTLKTGIRKIKERISQELKKELNFLIAEATLISPGKGQDMFDQLESNLNGITVSIGGPTEEEIGKLLADKATDSKFWSGKLNIKADSIEILVAIPDIGNFTLNLIQNSDSINDKVNTIVRNIYKKYADEYMDQIEAQMKGIKKDKAYTDYKRLQHDFFRAYEEQQNINEKINQEYTNLIENIHELSKDEEEQKQISEELEKERERFLNSLKESVYISTTAKTLNNYQNDIGFVGGSIGSGIVNQINNLNFLFTQAGIELTPEEIDWLIFAAINCSSMSVVGKSNQNLLETILGSLAIFALFDEGGAELKILKDRLESTKELTSPNIMHIYALNGIYYPGSFILTKVLENLEFLIIDLKNFSNIQGHKNISITNSTNLSQLPNKGVTNYSKLDTNPWQTMSERAIQSTNIRVLFLAGALDIINSLHQQMKDIKLPE